jgi:hypothetical protein
MAIMHEKSAWPGRVGRRRPQGIRFAQSDPERLSGLATRVTAATSPTIAASTDTSAAIARKGELRTI